ncbi:MAG TPA: hypothetical protein DCY42_00485, partial [Chloroflexi bacterium]|nr:hypothetical protein [Chloroflexota bacterium]
KLQLILLIVIIYAEKPARVAEFETASLNFFPVPVAFPSQEKMAAHYSDIPKESQYQSKNTSCLSPP